MKIDMYGCIRFEEDGGSAYLIFSKDGVNGVRTGLEKWISKGDLDKKQVKLTKWMNEEEYYDLEKEYSSKLFIKDIIHKFSLLSEKEQNLVLDGLNILIKGGDEK